MGIKGVKVAISYPLLAPDFPRSGGIIADIASAAGKKLIIGEAWLYKVDDSELAKRARWPRNRKSSVRDAYSFWEPLDTKFLEVLAKLAHYKHYEFISPFWSEHFFSYVDYDPKTRGLSYRERTFLVNTAANLNMLAGKYTNTGLAYKAFGG